MFWAVIEKTNGAVDPAEVGDIVCWRRVPRGQLTAEWRHSMPVSLKPIIVSVDDGIRPDTSLSSLAKLKPVFKKDGSTTAGMGVAHIQTTDGAAAVLLMKRRVAMRKGLPILGVFRSFTAVGVDPALMGVGPAVAIPAVVKSAGLELDKINLSEINEAFGSQFVYCQKILGLDPENINVNGGAMAIGHPLGATGARCVATMLHEMKRRGRDCRIGAREWEQQLFLKEGMWEWETIYFN
ncbi:3-ketoacyl-CoA thiolase 2, peroxisomal [Turnera subulata]|uniref:3-ketoacyl-CoA thiolase 2, peroxisomal n=1 Tax=Turnera subulata TaxID=218843 RepID=A0A9Q0FGQ8_9ROSI|nr:3-ketoacyl-CoA thiolase 2, peroxisomal [Turnera subulata]